MYKHAICFVAFLFASYFLWAQTTFTGIVKDAYTKKPLAFATIKVLNSKQGTTTDIDGKFSITSTQSTIDIAVSYIGYTAKQLTVNVKHIVIELNNANANLDEVLITNKINPAHRIIDSFLLHKNQNNPYNYKTFSYTCYTKAGIAAKDYMWKEMERIDTPKKLTPQQVEKLKKQHDAVRLDSAALAKMKQEKPRKDSIRKAEHLRDSLLEQGFKQNYLALTESYTERYFKAPNKTKEIVIATKFSGINNPNFSFTSSSFQPFGMYNNFIEMIGKSYQSPLTNGCKNDYAFTLQDVLINNNDTSFIISYKPKRRKNFLGLKGFIHINSNGWALENIAAKPAVDTSVMYSFALQQQYSWQNGNWFPKQLNTIIERRDKKNDSGMLYWDSKSYISNVKTNEPIATKMFDDIALDYKMNAGKTNDSLWNNYRTDTLNAKDKGTYENYKLIPTEASKVLNAIPKVLEIIALQAIPWGKVDVPFKDLFAGLNQYEKFRLGFGIRTNEYFSKQFTISSSIGYGFGDKSLKYAAGLQYNIYPKRNITLDCSFRQDVEEPTSISYFKSNSNLISNKTLRNFLTERMDSVQEIKLSFSAKPFPYLQTDVWLSNQQRNEGNSNYEFLQSNNQYTQSFTNTEIGVGLKYAYGETYQKLGRAKMLRTPATTQVLLYYSKGLNNVLNGSLNYDKVAFQINTNYITRKFGQTVLQLYGGQVFGNVPYSYLFNVMAANSSNNKKQYLYVPLHFQTVGLYEFANDRMVQFNWEQNFGTLFYASSSNISKPEFSISTNVAFGWLQNANLHKNISFKTLENGLLESGLTIKNIYRINYLNAYYLGLGLGAYYRYGANSYKLFKDNVAVKVSLNISL